MSSDIHAEEAPTDAGTYFDARARDYDAEYDKPTGYALRSRMEAVLEFVGDGSGEVLDAGMGAGRIVAALAERGWSVSGIDASKEMVVHARERLQGSAVRFKQGKIELLPFAGDSFDVVVATGVLEYSNVEAALRELGRVLRPGGVAIVSYPNPGNLYWLWRTHVWYVAVGAAKRILHQPALAFPRPSPKLEAASFCRLLESAGLEPERRRHTSFLVLPSPFDKLFPRTAERLGRVFEQKRTRLGRRLAGQVVYTARKLDRRRAVSGAPARDWPAHRRADPASPRDRRHRRVGIRRPAPASGADGTSRAKRHS